MEKKQHWENVYETKSPNEVSWTQENPGISLDLIRQTNLPKSAKIIDIGAGDSNLVDWLLKEGYSNLSVLDISSKAIEKAKNRLGEFAENVKWIVSDINDFQPEESYDLWHDRAAFHFLTDQKEIENYRSLTSNYISNSLIIGTFSKLGPKKCSGLNIVQYDERDLNLIFNENFSLFNSISSDHITPFSTIQNFQFCSFKKIN
ncbi:class I SAM-dependent methyltransferase [Halpernia frigidisoli]|uniref:Methyltransferase domain-containing protein n=1 Tax=Halpernia frigidisoli TaxID=1125876 RepID=A0A1I3GJG8_9FLAO|nr:class I SAM-dependent methyltransferase [Halpernia frigidisoli]SFI23626.1 Methyltransferase domain-containing protein [Halpernia frigidisoli]